MDPATVNVVVIVAIAVGLSLAWHLAAKRSTMACLGAALSSAVCAVAINWWSFGYAHEMAAFTFGSAFAVGFLIALGVGIPFRRYRARL